MTEPIDGYGQDIIEQQIYDILGELDEPYDFVLVFSTTRRLFYLSLNNNDRFKVVYSKYSDETIIFEPEDENDTNEEYDKWIVYLKDKVTKYIKSNNFQQNYIVEFNDGYSLADIDQSVTLNIKNAIDKNLLDGTEIYQTYSTPKEIETISNANPGVLSAYKDQFVGLGSYVSKQVKKIKKGIYTHSKEIVNENKTNTRNITSRRDASAGTGISQGPQIVENFIKRIGADKSSRKIGTQSPDFPISEDICVFVLDSGVWKDHPDINIDRELSRGFVQTGFLFGSEWDDTYGHGTHVAGIIGAIDNGIGVAGVAPGVKIIAYRVFPGATGTLSSLLNALASVASFKRKNPEKQCIVNMSLVTDPSDNLDKVVNNLTKLNVTVIVAAGNSNVGKLPILASNKSPGRATDVITVGAYDDSKNEFASFSGWGSSVQILAPGVRIRSTWINDKFNGYKLLDGTSQATPIVTGAVVNLIAKHINDYMKDNNNSKKGYKELTPREILNMLKKDSETERIKSNTNNPLIKVNANTVLEGKKLDSVIRNTTLTSIYIGNENY